MFVHDDFKCWKGILEWDKSQFVCQTRFMYWLFKSSNRGPDPKSGCCNIFYNCESSRGPLVAHGAYVVQAWRKPINVIQIAFLFFYVFSMKTTFCDCLRSHCSICELVIFQVCLRLSIEVCLKSYSLNKLLKSCSIIKPLSVFWMQSTFQVRLQHRKPCRT